MRNDAIKFGRLPKEDDWLCSPDRKRVYGRVLHVTKHGAIVYVTNSGHEAKLAHEVYQQSDYRCQSKAPPADWDRWRL